MKHNADGVSVLEYRNGPAHKQKGRDKKAEAECGEMRPQVTED